MSADLAVQLRSLTQDYHDGRLNFAAYRSMRAALLNSLVAGAETAARAAAIAAVAITQPRIGNWQTDAVTRPGKPRVIATTPATAAAVNTTAATATATAEVPVASTANEPASPRRLPLRTIAITVVVLAITGAGVWFWLDRSSSGTAMTDGATAAAEQDRIQTLLTRFTDRSDWGDAPLAMLNADLLEMGGGRLAESSSKVWFQRFVEEVRRRLKEQQALAATPLSADNSPLAALAVTVGLDLNAPDAAIHISALPPPRSAESPDAQSSTERRAAAATDAPYRSGAASASASVSAAAAEATEAAEAAAMAAKTGAATTLGSSERPASSPAAVTASSSAGTGTGTGTGTGIGIGIGTNTGTSTNQAPAATANAEAREGSCRSELIGTRRPFCHDLLPSGAEAPPLALIASGAFNMGSMASTDEQPIHHVTIRAPFAIAVYEVSQGEFKQFCEHTNRTCPTQPWSGDDYPVVNVSWDDARAYTAWLSSTTHQRYSLPTEAQWEYAARAGKTGPFPNGDTLSPTDAQYSMLTRQTAAARRSQKFNANAFRLQHTLGNVREWVEDPWSPNFSGAPTDGSAATAPQTTRVARGGSYTDGAARLRLSMREGLPAGTRDATTGFRIVRELP
jgi:formylglycine-generating enzyme required for sulfatase activity